MGQKKWVRLRSERRCSLPGGGPWGNVVSIITCMLLLDH